MSDARYKIASLLAALLVVASAVGGAGAIAVEPASGQAGLVGVPDANVADDYPRGTTPPIGAEQLEGSVMASRHAETLEVIATTSDRASDYLGGNATVVGSSEVALVLRDDVNSAGRDVAIDEQALIDALGYKPKRIYGTHEDGSRWSSSVEYSAGLLTFEVPHFSTNTISFSSEIRLTGSPASDGTSYAYDISSTDSVSNLTINVTGTPGAEWDNETGTGLSNGESLSLSIAGDLDPTGPTTNGEPAVEFTGTGSTPAENTWRSLAGANDEVGAVAHADGYWFSTGQFNQVQKYTESGDNLGSIKWTGRSVYALESDGTNLYVPNSDSVRLIKMDVTGAEAWNVSTPTKYAHLDHSGTHIAGANRYSEIAVYDDSTGSQEWYSDIGNGAKIRSIAANSSGYVWVSETAKDNVVALDSAGNIMWNRTNVGGGGSLALSNGKLYVETPDGIARLDAQTGATEWDVNHFATDAVSTTGNGSIFASENDRIVGYSTSDGSEFANFTTSNGDNVYFSQPGEMKQNGTHIGIAISTGSDYGMETARIPKPSTQDPSVDIDGDGSTDASYSGTLSEGESVTKELPHLSPANTSALIGTGAGTSVDATIHLRERVSTPSGGVQVNGEWTNFTALSVGESQDLSAYDSWITDGTNRVNVSLDGGSLSTDDPAPAVDLTYTHEATDNQTVDVTDEKLSARYNVSKTFASSRASATVTIPYQSTVYSIPTIEKRTNSSGWSSVPTDEYSLDESTLTVHLGAVDAGERVDVRSTGRKVIVSNGSISVLEPTTEGKTLDSRIRVDSWSGSSSYLSVASTSSGRLIHYPYNESWSDPDGSTRFKSNGEQRVRLPNAVAGSEFRLSTIPVRANPESGDVVVTVDDPKSTEPEFDVEPGHSKGDTVAFTYTDAQDSTSYILWSFSDEIVRDSGTANSPITLTDDDSEELLGFLIDDSGSSDPPPDEPGNVGEVVPGGSGAVSVGNSLFLVFVAALLAAVWFLTREFGSGGAVISTRMFFVAEAAIVAVLAIETISPASLVAGVAQAAIAFASNAGSGLASAWPLALLVLGGLGYFYLQQRGKPTKEQNFIFRAAKRRGGK